MQDKDKKKPHIKKPLNAFMLYMKVSPWISVVVGLTLCVGNATESCSRMYSEGECCHQPNTGAEGKR